MGGVDVGYFVWIESEHRNSALHDVYDAFSDECSSVMTQLDFLFQNHVTLQVKDRASTLTK